MRKINRDDHELTVVLSSLPASEPLTVEALPRMRAFGPQLAEQLRAAAPSLPNILTEDRMVPGPPGAPDVHVRVYRPAARLETFPALLWIHGGGFVSGSLDLDDTVASSMVHEVGCMVASVEYRLAPETPYPGPLEDCYAALRWLHDNALTLGIDPQLLTVGGASAGGGLAAGLALLARDRGEIPLCFQLLLSPMLDDRTATSAEGADHDYPIWTRANNRFGWTCYLGREPGGKNVPAYAAPARCHQLAGLPPAFISVGEVDLFLDEDIEYAQRLLRAGVPTELHVYPGGWHGFDRIAPDSHVAQWAKSDWQRAVKTALQKRPMSSSAAQVAPEGSVDRPHGVLHPKGQ